MPARTCHVGAQGITSASKAAEGQPKHTSIHHTHGVGASPDMPHGAKPRPQGPQGGLSGHRNNSHLSDPWLGLNFKATSYAVTCKSFHLTLNKKERVHFRSPKPQISPLSEHLICQSAARGCPDRQRHGATAICCHALRWLGLLRSFGSLKLYEF